jgi:hypothetical protein
VSYRLTVDTTYSTVASVTHYGDEAAGPELGRQLRAVRAAMQNGTPPAWDKITITVEWTDKESDMASSEQQRMDGEAARERQERARQAEEKRIADVRAAGEQAAREREAAPHSRLRRF